MIWQTVLLVCMLSAGLLILSRHMEGYREDAAQIASGTAMIVGLLLIVTGFTSIGDDEAPTPAAPRVVAPTASEPARALPAPVQQQIEQPPAPRLAVPTSPAIPEFNLGPAGDAYRRAEAIMLRYRDMYRQGLNDIQRTEMRFARGRELCQVQAPQYAVAARLGEVSTDKNGNARVTFIAPSGVEFIPDGEFARGSQVHTALANLAPGSLVAIMLTFDADETGKDCFHSNRWTEENNMTQPRWDVNVLGVTPLQ